MEKIIDAMNGILQTRQRLNDAQIQEVINLQNEIARQNREQQFNGHQLTQMARSVEQALGIDVKDLLAAIAAFKDSNTWVQGMPETGVPPWVQQVCQQLNSAIEDLYSEIYQAKEVVGQFTNAQGLQKIGQDFLMLKDVVEGLNTKIDLMQLDRECGK